MVVICAKTAELIKMLFGLWAWMGARNHVLDGGSGSPMGRGNFGDRGAYCKDRCPSCLPANVVKPLKAQQQYYNINNY